MCQIKLASLRSLRHCVVYYRDEVVAPQLQRALIGLNDSVQLLSSSMDAVVFRETWKAIAVAINRRMFNDVATETRFSYQV